MEKQYTERDIEQLDTDGNYFVIHMDALTRENLVGKSEIAAELAWRDKQIADLVESDISQGMGDMKVLRVDGDPTGRLMPDSFVIQSSDCDPVTYVQSDELDRLREVLKQARLTISHGRTVNNFGHVPTVRRALEWVLIDFDKALNQKATT